MPKTKKSPKFQGHSRIRVYCTLECPSANAHWEKFSKGNRVTFISAEEAEEDGYTPCKICNPK